MWSIFYQKTLKIGIKSGFDQTKRHLNFLKVFSSKKTEHGIIQMSFKKILKKILEVKHTSIDRLYFDGEDVVVKVHPTKGCRHRCGCCGCKGTFYDYGNDAGPRRWRSLDWNGHRVFLEYAVYRVYCPHCKAVHTCMVPWASHHSRFTHSFEQVTAWIMLQMNRTATSKFMRVAWQTVGDIAHRVMEAIASTSANPLDGLRYIGIDETSYRKGHNYMTVVVDHERGKVVWVHEGYGEDVLKLFFEQLGPERCKAIKLVSCDGAKWIRKCIEKYCGSAERCVDPFHVIQWAMESLDKVRSEFWRKAKMDEPKIKRGKGRPPKGEEKKEPLSQVIKNSKYAMGKAPENLTEKQQKKRELIALKCPTLYRASVLKESLRIIFSMDYEQAKVELDKWIVWARHCHIKLFVELQRKIRRHYDGILASIKHGISNARIEAVNNKIKLVIRMAYGFRNIGNMLAMVMLKCGCYTVSLPWDPAKDAA